MTDKQIIIDGVDVSGCEHRCDTHKTLLADGHIMEFKNYCQITNDGCYAINCYYKQLKRKEQEYEELKEDVERWKRNFNGKVSAIEELIKIIQQALEDFSIEVGTPQYDRLLNSAKSLGIGVKDYE